MAQPSPCPRLSLELSKPEPATASALIRDSTAGIVPRSEAIGLQTTSTNATLVAAAATMAIVAVAPDVRAHVVKWRLALLCRWNEHAWVSGIEFS